MSEGMWIQYPSSIEQFVECNDSFDSCVLRICYTGENRNKSSISKQAIEDAIPSIYNCPIVCNYNVYEDTIGSHDIEVVSTNNGMRMINLTDAIGVIPQNSKYYWETINDDGVDHEYLCVEAILWKRSAVYSKIKREGIVSQSMEITVKDGKTVDDIYEIDKFIFTAFCLLGDNVEPCFESASLSTFGLDRCKYTLDNMMEDFKKHFSEVNPSIEDDIKLVNKQNLAKGGNISLDKMNLLSEYGLTLESLDFNIEDFTVEELKAKFEAEKNTDSAPKENPTAGDSGKNKSEIEDTHTEKESASENYSLVASQMESQLRKALCAVKYKYLGEYECCKYLFIDYDNELSTVYAFDDEDGELYGFLYSMNGDNVEVDFESKTHKKISYTDFDEGDAALSFKCVLDTYKTDILASKDLELNRIKGEIEEKYALANSKIKELESELSDLRQYKKDKMDKERLEAENELFARFNELDGIEAFNTLREGCSEMSLDEIENKCFEIKGRNTKMNFSANKTKPTRLAVEKKKFEDEPYGGLFIQFPPTNY